MKKPVKIGNSNFQEFINYVGSKKLYYKIGFDSCTVPALLQNPGNIDLVSLDTCEAARWSAYVTPDLKLLPCSFDKVLYLKIFAINFAIRIRIVRKGNFVWAVVPFFRKLIYVLTSGSLKF